MTSYNIRFRTASYASLFGFLLALSGLVHSTEVEKQLEIGFSSDLLVSQGEVFITQADVDAFLATIPEQDHVPFLSNPERIGQLLRNLILSEAMAKEALNQEYIHRLQYQTQLYRVLVNELSRIYRRELLAGVELDDYTDRAREMFLANPGRFTEEPKIDFYHVLIAVGNERNEVQAMRRVADAWDGYHDGLYTIEELVQTYSDDSSHADNQGLIEGVRLSDLERAVAVVLSEQREGGSLSDPIRTSFGWHLVRLHKRHDPEEVRWEAVKNRAIEAARDEHRARTIERRLRDFQDPEHQFAPGAIQTLLNRYGATFERHKEDSSTVESAMSRKVDLD